MNDANKPVKLLGFASGNYFCKCLECEETFTGDKRATQCLPCAANQAEILLKERATEKPKAGMMPAASMRLAILESLVHKQGREINELYKRSFS